MTSTTKWVTEPHGAVVATVLETYETIVEVLKRSDGKFDLIIHRRCGDGFDDLTATVEAGHLIALGSLPTLAIQGVKHDWQL